MPAASLVPRSVRHNARHGQPRGTFLARHIVRLKFERASSHTLEGGGGHERYLRRANQPAWILCVMLPPNNESSIVLFPAAHTLLRIWSDRLYSVRAARCHASAVFDCITIRLMRRGVEPTLAAYK
jgi:hypothetical protein